MNAKELNQDVVELPAYQVPEVTTFTEEELLEEMGPAQAGSVPNGNVI